LLLCAFALFAVSAFTEVEYQDTFTQWMIDNGKSYAPTEFFYRYDIFKANMDFVTEHNAANHTYTVELNRFADLTSGEFKKIYNGYLGAPRRSVDFSLAKVSFPTGSVDWTTQGVVTPVKDQGQCGSCWAFSTTGSMEGAIAIAHGKNALVSLSEQELVDCGAAYGNLGCNGGLMDRAFKYAEANGLCTEAAYPYTAANGQCKKSSCTASPYTMLKGYKDVTAKDENALATAVQLGPVSVAIEADQAGFQMYKSGVFSGVCGENLDHGVLVVGYGVDNGQEYWKVKNSWGTSWGEQGYIRMIEGKDECGIADQPSYPLSG